MTPSGGDGPLRTVERPPSANIAPVSMREDCRHFQSRTYSTGEVARFCVLNLAPEAPWRCPDDCPRYQPDMIDGSFVVGSLARPAVESEPTRDMGRVADQEFDVEAKVRDLDEIAFEHRAIAGEAERPAVMTRVVGDEAVEIPPILPVQAGDVAPVEVGESGFGHDQRS